MAMRILSVLVLASAAAAAGAVRADDSTADQIGDRLHQAAKELKQEGREAVGQIRESWEQARKAVDRLGIEGRVYGRLKWDKALAGADLRVDVREGKVAVLKGTVPTSAARDKAKQLAADTVGVESVVDELEVR